MSDSGFDQDILQQVDPATVIIWRWEAIVGALFGACASFVPLSAVSLTAATALASLMLVIGMVWSYWWPKARYRHLRYGLDDFGLIVQSGVYWRKQITLPRVRIQHSDVAQGPLQRRYGIATLKLYTAGSRYTKIELEGLRHEEALALRDSLVMRTRAIG